MSKEVDHVNHKGLTAENDVLELMHTLMHQVRSRSLRGISAGDQPISHMEGKVLGFVARHPGATQGELVAHSGRDKGQLARLVAGMKDKGLLETTPDDNDRRVVRLHLTELARTLHAGFARQRRQMAAKAVSGLSAEQKRQLVELLHLMQANLRETEED